MDKMDDYIMKIQILNQLPLQKSLLVCTICEKTLSAPIYLLTDGNNYCDHCSVTNNITRIRNESLEIVNSKLLYPCFDCDFVVRGSDFANHKYCLEKSIICKYCIKEPVKKVNNKPAFDKKDEFESSDGSRDSNSLEVVTYNNYLDHIYNDHEKIATHIKLNKTSVVLPIRKATRTEQLFFVHGELMGDYKFLVIVSSICNNVVELTVAAPHCSPNPTDNAFFIKYENMLIDGIFHNAAELFQSEDIGPSKESIRFLKKTEDDKEKTMDVTIYFRHSEGMFAIGECPICFNQYSEDIYICKNGHKVCSNCVSNIVTCPVCRIDLGKTKFSISDLLPTVSLPCPNAGRGCLCLVKINEMKIHTDVCNYQKVTCLHCKMEYSKHEIYEHFAMCTRHLCINLGVCSSPFPSVDFSRFATISYNNKLFKMNTLKSSDMIKFNVLTLYNTNTEIAQNYRYEIHVLPTSDAVFAAAIVNGMVSPNLKKQICSSEIPSRIFELFSKNGFIYIRICIFEIDMVKFAL